MQLTRTYLEKHDPKYQKVATLFHKSNSTRWFSLYLHNIEEVENLELKRRFKRKEEKYRRQHGFVNIIQVYHGTKKSNISSILKNNLDVNRHGLNIGHRFGAGVSFSAFAYYSSHYCDETSGWDSQMLLCDVLVSNIIEVPENKHSTFLEPPFIEGFHPPLRYDTTAKNKTSMDVIVKFENHTFYPAFVIHFRKIHKAYRLPSPRVNNSISNLPCTSLNYSLEGRHQSASQFPRSSDDTDTDTDTETVKSQNVWERPARKSTTISRVQQERSYVYLRNENLHGWHRTPQQYPQVWDPQAWTPQPHNPSNDLWSSFEEFIASFVSLFKLIFLTLFLILLFILLLIFCIAVFAFCVFCILHLYLFFTL